MTYVLKIHGSDKVLCQTEYSDVLIRLAIAMTEWHSSRDFMSTGELDQPLIDVFKDGELYEQWGYRLKHAVGAQRLDKTD